MVFLIKNTVLGVFMLNIKKLSKNSIKYISLIAIIICSSAISDEATNSTPAENPTDETLSEVTQTQANSEITQSKDSANEEISSTDKTSNDQDSIQETSPTEETTQTTSSNEATSDSSKNNENENENQNIPSETTIQTEEPSTTTSTSNTKEISITDPLLAEPPQEQKTESPSNSKELLDKHLATLTKNGGIKLLKSSNISNDNLGLEFTFKIPASLLTDIQKANKDFKDIAKSSVTKDFCKNGAFKEEYSPFILNQRYINYIYHDASDAEIFKLKIDENFC
jgi:hypothetical protein